MPLNITYVSGNTYRIHDAFVVAEAELFGGGGGMAINLRSIRHAESTESEGTTKRREFEEALIAHLGRGLAELKRFRTFVVAYRGMVVASNDPDTPTGSRIPTQIT